ncbi:MAG: alpha-amylase/4-alpha-glucanotransferase domain-containing protein [Verrucomicrobiota bacterium]
MKRVTLHLAFHHHQPVGNLESVLEDIYQQCYRPLLEGIASCSCIRVNLSYSAPVLRFLEKRHPEYLEILRDLLEQDRVELMATGFYEPVLADLPEVDRQGQLGLSKRWYQERFGQEPRGAWLSEAVWDKSLVSTFREVGIGYTIIRSERFIQAGISTAALRGYYITEEIGQTLAVFPNSEDLQKYLPFGEPSELKPFLRRMANRSGMILTLADVAERWGAWPGTHEPIHQQGGYQAWLDFFKEVQDWVKFALFSETLDSKIPQGNCYLPGGVNIDLGAWSLPDEARVRFYEARKDLEIRHDASRFLPFFRGGCWESFKARYSEANLMNKKGLWLRRKMLATDSVDPVAQDWLWQTQCNTAYWHGTSGGIYSPHLRQAVWERLLAAQRRLNLSAIGWMEEICDVGGDGLDEVLYDNEHTEFAISPAKGGTLYEWSVLPALHNYCNTLTRRHETAPQDKKFSEVSPKSGGPTVDAYDRQCFHDHVISRKVTVEELSSGTYFERGSFIHAPYKLVSSQIKDGQAEVVMECSGYVEQGGLDQAARVRKSFTMTPDGKSIRCHASLTNEGKTTLEGVYALEFNWSLCPQQGESYLSVSDRRKKSIDDGVYVEGVDHAIFTSGSEYPEIVMDSPDACILWALPMATQQSAEPESPSLIQGHMVLAGWSFEVAPGQDVSFEIRLSTPNVHYKKVD